MHKYSIKLSGINCAACVKLAKMDLEEVPGVSAVNIDDAGNGEISSEIEIEKSELESSLKNETYIEKFEKI